MDSGLSNIGAQIEALELLKSELQTAEGAIQKAFEDFDKLGPNDIEERMSNIQEIRELILLQIEASTTAGDQKKIDLYKHRLIKFEKTAVDFANQVAQGNHDKVLSAVRTFRTIFGIQDTSQSKVEPVLTEEARLESINAVDALFVNVQDFPSLLTVIDSISSGVLLDGELKKPLDMRAILEAREKKCSSDDFQKQALEAKELQITEFAGRVGDPSQVEMKSALLRVFSKYITEGTAQKSQESESLPQKKSYTIETYFEGVSTERDLSRKIMELDTLFKDLKDKREHASSIQLNLMNVQGTINKVLFRKSESERRTHFAQTIAPLPQALQDVFKRAYEDSLRLGVVEKPQENVVPPHEEKHDTITLDEIIRKVRGTPEDIFYNKRPQKVGYIENLLRGRHNEYRSDRFLRLSVAEKKERITDFVARLGNASQQQLRDDVRDVFLSYIDKTPTSASPSLPTSESALKPIRLEEHFKGVETEAELRSRIESLSSDNTLREEFIRAQEHIKETLLGATQQEKEESVKEATKSFAPFVQSLFKRVYLVESPELTDTREVVDTLTLKKGEKTFTPMQKLDTPRASFTKDLALNNHECMDFIVRAGYSESIVEDEDELFRVYHAFEQYKNAESELRSERQSISESTGIVFSPKEYEALLDKLRGQALDGSIEQNPLLIEVGKYKAQSKEMAQLEAGIEEYRKLGIEKLISHEEEKKKTLEIVQDSRGLIKRIKYWNIFGFNKERSEQKKKALKDLTEKYRFDKGIEDISIVSAIEQADESLALFKEKKATADVVIAQVEERRKVYIALKNKVVSQVPELNSLREVAETSIKKRIDGLLKTHTLADVERAQAYMDHVNAYGRKSSATFEYFDSNDTALLQDKLDKAFEHSITLRAHKILNEIQIDSATPLSMLEKALREITGKEKIGGKSKVETREFVTTVLQKTMLSIADDREGSMKKILLARIIAKLT